MRLLLSVDPEIPVPPTLYGGIERVVAALIEHLRERGHTVGLIAHADSRVAVDARWAWPGQRSGSKLDTLRNIACLARASREFRPQVVHSFSRLAYLLPRLLARAPTLMSYQREPSLRSTALALRLSGGHVQFSGCSGYIAALGSRAGGTWHAIPNFVDLDKFPFVPNVAPDAPLVFLSRVESIKGAHWAIEIARRSGRPLVIAGNRVDHGDGARYFDEQIAPALGRDGISYIGAVDDVAKARLLGAAAAMVVPIQWDEPFGIVFAEALACGTPVISCPRGALPEIVEHGRHGFLIDSIDAGINAVAQLDALDRADCRTRAEEHYSRSVVGDQYAALYAQLTAR